MSDIAKLSSTACLALLLGGCTSLPLDEPPPTERRETVWAVTGSQQLIRFNAGEPRRIAQRLSIGGLPDGETVVGIDFRVSHGRLYGLTSAGRVVTLDTATARATPLTPTPQVVLEGKRFGMDFNPVADRIRVVSDTGQNLRFHPETGALVAGDPRLSGAAAGSATPAIAAAGYTYNRQDEKLTTNFAIDLARGWLVTQGSIEGRQPVVSPNTGRIADVGPLGTGPLQAADLDIADTDNTALAALRLAGRTRLYRIDLATGRAALLGTVDQGGAVHGLAIQP